MPSTVPYDHPSGHTVQTPSTAKRHKSSNATGEVASRQSMKIAHQKVNLDIDLANRIVTGETEITVLPLEQNLRHVKLDCRNIQINEVLVNNKKATYHYKDFHENDEYLNNPDNYHVKDLTPGRSSGYDFKFNPQYDINSNNFDIHQHHFYKGKFHPIYGNTNHLEELNIKSDPEVVQQNYHHPYTPLLLTNTEELQINFPEGVRLKLQNSNSIANFSPAKSTHNTPFSSANTLINQDQVYTPVNIKIKYTVRNPKNGLVFNGGLQTKISRDKWYCYTINNDLNFSTSCWVPCVDNNYEKNTWDINISIPKTIGDIGDSKIIGTRAADIAIKKQQRKDDDDYDDDEELGESDIDLKRDLIVASPELLNFTEVPHTTDFSKKIFSFQVYNPVASQHIGFAVGPFEKFPLIGFKEEVKDPEADLNGTNTNISNVSTTIYFLPGKKNEVINTSIFLYKAMDFYSKEFGSFPFNSYSIAFLEDMPSRSCGFAGLSIVSDKIIYSTDKVEPILPSTEALSTILAEQWSGINVVPKSHNDIWCVLGIAEFMASQFLKKLFGLNEFKYRNKLKTDLVCEQDIRKRPLANQFFRFPINDDSDFAFLKLKSSLVMIILDHRMTKTDKSFGLSRVIPKLFLQAMSNDLFNGNCLSTYHFKHVCEKVNHNRLDNFFKNWIYSSGTPVLKISQRFNKKRMVIELTVRQVQILELNNRNDDGTLISGLSSETRHADDNFINDSINFLENDDSEFNVPAIFQGPMTIRVHEADGTPYEHIVELKDAVSKLDIPYNTKYRRLKRGRRRQQEPTFEEDLEDGKVPKEQIEEVKVNCLGDVLQSTEEVRNWNLQEWSREDEENQLNESFEWIRVDADFEWICKVHLNQPDYMFHSQLQQDRDVEAQIDSVRYFSNAIKPTSIYSSILTKTLMDKRYFYGVRVEAAIGLAKLAKEELGFIGLKHLLKCFQELYCFKTPYNILAPINSINYLPLPNDFEDFGSLFVLKIIPKALSSVRLPSGEVPLEVRKILLNLLKFNDNLNNEFDDCFYMANVIESIFTSICHSGGFSQNQQTDESSEFMRDVNTELKRILKLDEFLPSFDHVITCEIIKQRAKATRLGLDNLSYKELLPYTLPSVETDLRLVAFEGILNLGGLKNASLLHYFFTVSKIDDSQKLRAILIEIFMKSIAIAAIHGAPSILDDPEFDEFYFSQDFNHDQSNPANGDKNSGMVFIEDGSSKMSMNSRRDAHARATISGAISILRRDYSFGKGLKTEIWSALHSNLLSIHSKRNLFDVCDVMYETRDSFIVTIDKKNEKKIVAKVGKVDITDSNTKVYEISLQRKGRLKIQIPNFLDKKKIKKPKIKSEGPTPLTTLPKIKLLSKSSSSNLNLNLNSNSKVPEIDLTLDEDEGKNKSLPKAPAKISLAAPKLTTAQPKKRESKFISLKFNSLSSKEKLKTLSSTRLPKDHVEITRSSPALPLRYVRISTKNKLKLQLSTDSFQVVSARKANSFDSTVKLPNKPVTILNKDLYGEYPQFKLKINYGKSKFPRGGSMSQEEIVKSTPQNFVKSETAPPIPVQSNSAGEQQNGSTAESVSQTQPKITIPIGPKSESDTSTPVPPAARPKIKLKFNLDKTKK